MTTLSCACAYNTIQFPLTVTSELIAARSEKNLSEMNLSDLTDPDVDFISQNILRMV